MSGEFVLGGWGLDSCVELGLPVCPAQLSVWLWINTKCTSWLLTLRPLGAPKGKLFCFAGRCNEAVGPILTSLAPAQLIQKSTTIWSSANLAARSWRVGQDGSRIFSQPADWALPKAFPGTGLVDLKKEAIHRVSG